MVAKFVFIVVCFIVALLSYIICRSKRDWLWLTLGLGFTAWADYFLVLHNRHLIGVAVFCFAHMAYILRALQGKKCWFIPLLVVPVVVLAYISTSIFIVSGLYAMLFITSIYVNARYIRHNRMLVIAGLLLFAACDICVFIFNLPLYMGAPYGLMRIFPLIWIFYLPAQAILSVSAVDFSRIFPLVKHCSRRR